MSYIERNESLKWARLNGEALISDVFDNTIEYLPLNRSENKSLELNLVYNFSCGVLNAAIRHILRLHATQQILSEFMLTKECE